MPTASYRRAAYFSSTILIDWVKAGVVSRAMQIPEGSSCPF
ncbi:hypothetical protein ACFL45_04030 [Candidatus Neomarinimicrobiota bacterium]